MYFEILAAGFGGGAVRGIVGFIKHQLSYKNIKFDVYYFLGMIFVSGAIGLMVSAVIKEIGILFLGSNYFSPAIAFIVGYAGGDFLENIYKIIIKKSSLVDTEQNQK